MKLNVFKDVFRGFKSATNPWIYFFGDSVFDCGRYNQERETPGSLLTRNRDDLFPKFEGKDLQTRFPRYQVRDLSIDGALIEDLLQQYRGAYFTPDDVVFLSVGGNDFLRGLHQDQDGGEIDDFLHQYGFILSQIPAKKVVANVYDPFFGSVEMNSLFPSFLDRKKIRKSYNKLNQGIELLAHRYGTLLDLRKHFLTGDPSWFERTIEPSLRGASEIRRVVWDVITKNNLLEGVQESKR